MYSSKRIRIYMHMHVPRHLEVILANLEHFPGLDATSDKRGLLVTNGLGKYRRHAYARMPQRQSWNRYLGT